MDQARDARLANLLAVVATGLTDLVTEVAVAELDGTSAAAIVALLDFSPSCSVRTLSAVLGLTHPGAVRVVDRLVQAGYVRRAPGADLRSVSVELTATGRTRAQQIRVHRQEAMNTALAGFTDEQREQLAAACALLITNLTNQRLERRAVGARPVGGALCRMCDFDACGRPAGRCPAAAAAQVWTASRRSPEQGQEF